MKKALAPTSAERFPSASAIVEALLPVNLQDKIPKRAKEKVSNHTGKDYSLNIGNALAFEPRIL